MLQGSHVYRHVKQRIAIRTAPTALPLVVGSSDIKRQLANGTRHTACELATACESCKPRPN